MFASALTQPAMTSFHNRDGEFLIFFCHDCGIALIVQGLISAI
jgi:hypothetical protein